MYIEILLLAIPAFIIFGLCASTDRIVTIRQSQRMPNKRSRSSFE
jgi:regulator of PEP synthase PpsR (kinase-PPPase family)